MSKLESTHGLTARVEIGLLDADGKPVAWICCTAPIGAGDSFGVVANLTRLASQVAERFHAELDKAKAGSLIVLDIRDVERRNAIGAYLRKLADELKGKTLYHPETSLRFYADEVDPSTETIRQRYEALTRNDRRPLSEIVTELPAAQKSEPPAE